MGRTENPTDRLEASRGHRHWAKEIRSNQTLFGVGGEVRSKNNLTEPALLEMSGNATNRELTTVLARVDKSWGCVVNALSTFRIAPNPESNCKFNELQRYRECFYKFCRPS